MTENNQAGTLREAADRRANERVTLTKNILSLSTEVGKASKTVALQWPGIVEADDVEQMLYQHLLERPNVLNKLIEDFDDKQRLNAIIKLGHQIAAGERTDYEHFSGNFRYSVEDVKRLLEDRALHNDSPELGSSWSVAEEFTNGGDFESAVIRKSSGELDLQRGMDRLIVANPSYADIIRRRFLGGETFDNAERMHLHRALTSLATQMNRSFKRSHAERTDGPGTRRVMSRAGAYKASSSDWDGDE